MCEERDCNELEQLGEFGAHALLERAVRRIEEKDQVIRRLNLYIDALLDELQSQAATYTAPVAVLLDDVPAGIYEPVDDLDDYEYQQELYGSNDVGC